MARLDVGKYDDAHDPVEELVGRGNRPARPPGGWQRDALPGRIPLPFHGPGAAHALRPYDAGHYLVVTSPMPILCRTIASADAPVLSMVVEIELALLREMVLEFERSPRAAVGRSTHTVFSAPLPRDLEDAAARLLACLADERRTRALARQTIREMLFLVLDGPQGDSLRALAEGPASQLADVVREMNARFAERMAIGDLAQIAHMSVPTFHQHFKAMTGTSPLQYMKAVRLIRARQLLLGGGMVKTVAHDVGYESETQFSREYRRFFGSPPSATSHITPLASSSPREGSTIPEAF